jgi:hypothetical protein
LSDRVQEWLSGSNHATILAMVAASALQDVFGPVLFVVVAVCVVVGLLTLGRARRSYDEIGRGGLSLRDGTDRPLREPAAGGLQAQAESEEEVRQLIAAHNAHRARRGEPPLDVEAELRRLRAPVVDAALREEVRQLVVARNARRVQRGQEPLDVDAEIDRQLRELAPEG